MKRSEKVPEDKKKIAVENAKKALESNQFNARGLKRKSKLIEVIDDKIMLLNSVARSSLTNLVNNKKYLPHHSQCHHNHSIQ